MTRPTPLSQIVADDLLIDRVAGRQPAGDDPIASLLAALADHADRPLGNAPTGRRFRRHRVLSALAALTIGASGAGVAAAATVPAGTPSAASAAVARTPDRPASDLAAAELVRDAAGRVLVVGLDGTRFDSAWLPDGVSPVLLTPAGALGRASGAEASRSRWAVLAGSVALLMAGPEQSLEGPDPGAVDSIPKEGAEQDAAAGPADEAATPVDPAAAPVDEPAAEPAAEPDGAATSEATPSEDATPAATPSDDATDQSAGTYGDDVTPSAPGTTGPAQAGRPADTGKPADAGKPAQTGYPGAGSHSGTGGAADQQPQAPPALGVPAPAGSTQADDTGLVDMPTIPVMVPLPTIPMAVVADPS